MNDFWRYAVSHLTSVSNGTDSLREIAGAIMRRMMTTRQTAQALGVSERVIYRVIRRTGARWHLARECRGGSYLFSNEDVLWLAEVLGKRNLHSLRATLGV
ncbi:helix-turn-helix domain-containing protein [Mycobacterium sp. IDR2000157661]|uniref:helix-turn-helix domain-containing protein n=1 Tax=Mycobacterium sp. IDR2000157661 TaxID=2867005 RepID=UPI001EEA76EF|nr:helix-turn-helix domain-containing protein [Mycobacterium sp. IDR2000157661]ULE34366.1 helix-turn-helix domain-containing protein [Mycobacterium sp. IDR2000157661]